MKKGKRALLWLLSAGLLPWLALSGKAAAPEVRFPVSIRLTGEAPAMAESYTVRLTAADHAPLSDFEGIPSAAEQLDLTITGAGTAEFPPIAYERVGVYRYALSLLPGSDPRAKYDASTYAVTVTVMNGEDGGLEKTVVFVKDGKKQDSAEFVVDYPSPPKPSPSPQLIKTGQQRLPVLYLAVAGTVLMALGAILTGRKNHE